ncbi:uncharacterized protein CC84DRAFT_1222973 [Paraphaeosphaeria sporulosa]|uniref:Uncharacterized protein n=1 Tax=Paraphaeosphaeria sporulosa TaxID=1460663 RepID=A0A177BXN7_9PLEO|nr:uncharacterized protein CC84DRAFT_1222973 [Paraphaeosphaeria sporulosa]OAF99277.1 hypothetical protein CC84DRAFT_1222973 [Paraphaeosphaeria sporulosa]
MNGPLQNLPSPHAHTNGCTLHYPPVTNGNASSSQNQPDPSERHPFLHILTNFTRIASSFLRHLWKSVGYWSRPAVSLIVYGLTVYTAWTAPNQHTLLGRVSPSLGTWILAIFAKAGDICFAFAIEDTFDALAWRKLGSRHRRYDVVPLEWFLSMTSSTGIEGLTRLLWRRSRLRRWTVRYFGRLWRAEQVVQTSEGEGEVASWERRWRDWWKGGRYFRWPFARLLFVAVMIPGPGIILLANIDQATVFFDVRSMNVSAGLATYDPTIANATRNVVAPIISRYMHALLQDRSLTWPVDPIDPLCSTGKNCNASLIAGPYSTVSPWPFPRANESVGIDGFRINNAPFYQVDMWDWEPGTVTFSESRNCVVYGGLDAFNEFSTSLCISQQDSEGVLAAGWASCQLGYSPTNYSCLARGGREEWGTFFRFYRRNATLVFSRSDLQILSVTDLSPPQPQNITPAALFTVLDTILYRPDRADSALKFYDVRSAEYLLTQMIGVQLWYSLYNNSAGLPVGRDWLKNLVSLPVYVFQPTSIELVPYLPALAADNGTRPQPNLPRENYVEGAYCVIDKRSIPGLGTVYAYIVVAGLLLAFVIIAKGRALLWDDVATSDFAIFDYHILTRIVDMSVQKREVSPDQILQTAGGEYSTSQMLDQIPNLRIGLR